MHLIFDSPSKPEQREGDKHSSNVRQRKSEFRFCITIILFAEMVVDGVNSRHNEPESDEKPKTWSKIHKTHLRSIEAVERAVDGLEVCVQRVGGSEENSLIDSHSEDDRLGEENSEGPGHAVDEPPAEWPVVLVDGAVFRSVGGGVVNVRLFAVFEDRGSVRFFEEEEADNGVEGADDCKDPEDPAPVEILDYQATEKGPECGA